MTRASFGSTLRGLRERAGMTQEQLAAAAGLSVRAISALERDERRHPYPHTLRSVGEALGLTADERALLEAAVGPRGLRRQLPSPLSSLVGREAEVEAIVERLASGKARLLTITGPGGAGKTRVAIAAGERVAATFADGVVFVPLAPLSDADLVLPTIAHAMDVQETGALPVREMVFGYLRARSLLLVLDNLEHLPDAVADVAALLATAPRVSALVTSRAPLRVQGEHVFPLRPLPAEAAVELFRVRTAEAAPDAGSDPAVTTEICRQLDCLPLAIELAAARARVLPPSALLGRLDRPLAILTGGGGDLPDRQQALSTTIAWSHDLLSGAGQVVFRRLAVFSNGWRLDDAAAVVGVDETAALDTHGALVDGSLIVRLPEAGEPRFGMLETIRAFAGERLRSSGEEASVRDRHAARYDRLAMTAGRELWGPAQAEWLERLDLDVDNLRVAMRRRAELGDGDGLAEVCFALRMFWWIRGLLEEGRQRVEGLLEGGGPLRPSSRARLLCTCGHLLFPTGRVAEALPMLDEAVRLARGEGDAEALGWSLVFLGFAAVYQARYGEAATLLDEAAALGRREGIPDIVVRTAMGEAHAAVAQGRMGDAEAVLAARLVEVGEGASPWSRGAGRAVRGRVLLAMGELERAEDVLHDAVRILSRLRDQVVIGASLAHLAAAAALRADPQRAARLFGAADAMDERSGASPWPWYREMPRRGRAAALDRLGAGAFDALYLEGRAMSFEDAVALAMRGRPSSAP